MVQILFTVFGMGYIYENAQIIDNHGTLLHRTVLITKHDPLINRQNMTFYIVSGRRKCVTRPDIFITLID